MTNRVCLGQRSANSASGLWVSQPGYDVLTCNSAYLLFEANSAITRVIAQGTINVLANAANGTQYVIPLTNTNGHIPMAQYFELTQGGTGAQYSYGAACTTGSVNSTAFTMTIIYPNFYGTNWSASYVIFSEVIS